MPDFGVIVTCNKADFLFAKGCCASIRYFMGDVPICLLVDGDFSVESIVETYNTLVISRKDVKNQMLATRCTGWGLTKMIAFWESPFDHFLLLDADTCVWGDVSVYADFSNNDAIIDVPCYSYKKEDINKYFFDVENIRKLFPDFDYNAHSYVCTGVIFGKKNMFDIAEYAEILALLDKHPRLFKYGEMGFLNFMFFRAKQDSRLKIGTSDIQHLITDFDFAKSKSKFLINTEPVVAHPPTVIHWAGGDKPVKSNSHIYSEPMSFFRKKFLKDKKNTGLFTDTILAIEDYQWLLRKRFSSYKIIAKHFYKQRQRKVISKVKSYVVR
jgi:hypothetical protein